MSSTGNESEEYLGELYGELQFAAYDALQLDAQSMEPQGSFVPQALGIERSLKNIRAKFQNLTPEQNESFEQRHLEFLKKYFDLPVYSEFPITGVKDIRTLQNRWQEVGMLYLVTDRKSTRLNSSHTDISRMPSSA